ncbi:MAG TPA: DUF4440 domain-containing protein [Ignavibacteriaceae bacterium]|nr:DUF4440 domain-containing protein [Ignavibacteriaceae bacterium]
MKRFVILLVYSLPLLLISCTQQKAEFDSASVKKIIDENNTAFGNYSAKGDSVSVANLYTEDAVLLPPNSAMVKGRDGIESVWGSFFRLGKIDIKLTAEDVYGEGSIAVETGKYDLTIQPEGTTPIKDHGKYIVVWQKQSNNSWKLKRDIWNSNLPAASN